MPLHYSRYRVAEDEDEGDEINADADGDDEQYDPVPVVPEACRRVPVTPAQPSGGVRRAAESRGNAVCRTHENEAQRRRSNADNIWQGDADFAAVGLSPQVAFAARVPPGAARESSNRQRYCRCTSAVASSCIVVARLGRREHRLAVGVGATADIARH